MSKNALFRDLIKLCVYDFDGVMTDNSAYVFEDGREAVRVNRSDGLAVRMIRDLGIHQVIISTERNPIVSARAVKLAIPVLQGIDNKKTALIQYVTEQGVDLSEVAYIGNDVNDASAMRLVGWSIAPADAHSDIRKIAKIVLKTSGGQGVVREFFDVLNFPFNAVATQ